MSRALMDDITADGREISTLTLPLSFLQQLNAIPHMKLKQTMASMDVSSVSAHELTQYLRALNFPTL